MIALTKSADPELESLRRILAAPAGHPRPPQSPDALDVVVTTPSGKRETAYTALFREGFLFMDLDRIGFTRFTEANIDAHQALLSAYESVALVRSRFVRMKRSKPALEQRYQEFTKAAATDDAVGTVLAFQRLMLTCVAGVANERLMKTYVSAACLAYCYAWASRLPDPALSSLTAGVAAFYDLYDRGDVVTAARLVADLRARGSSNENLAP